MQLLPLMLCNWNSWWVAYQQNPSFWTAPILDTWNSCDLWQKIPEVLERALSAPPPVGCATGETLEMPSNKNLARAENLTKKMTQLTESTAKHCMSGSEHSRSFWTILRKLSTNRFRDCEWHVTSRMSKASTTITTYLKTSPSIFTKKGI